MIYLLFRELQISRKKGEIMNYSILITPLIGACIGYVTNYIAVKMLFRPLHPVKIGKFQLPFTPGLIPKEKSRLAKAIGEIVGNRLVTKDGIEKMLLSDEVKDALRSRIHQSCNHSSTSLEQFMVANVSYEKTETVKETVTQETSMKIKQSILDANIGDTLAKEITKSIKEYFQGGFLAMMINDSVLSSIETHIAHGITSYVENNGEKLIEPYIRSELDKIFDLTLQDAKNFTDKHDIPIDDILINIYVYVVTANTEKILSFINVGQIAEDEINKMDVLELEELILSVMKQELNAIVNLGALIGFVLGLVNLFLK